MICPKCNQPKVRYGIYVCKECRTQYLKKWSNKNRDRLNARSRTWVIKNKEKRKEIIKAYQEKNKPIKLKMKRDTYAKRVKEGRQKNYKTDPLTRREIKNRYRVKKLNVPSEKYSAKKIFEKFNFICAYCSNDATELDHVIPISRGGPDVESNLVAACKSCNCSKGNKTIEEWIEMKLG
jgi:5-methylcytosine-specific restriction endonuclease McrA